MTSSDPRAASAALGHALTRALPLLLLATVALLGITPIGDGDVWWHLKFGEYFLQDRSFPPQDPFATTAAGGRWIIRAWLAEVIFALVFRAGGATGLILTKAALFTAAVGVLWRLGAAVRCPPPAAALTLLLAGLAARPRLVERPEVFSFLLVAAALAILVRVTGAARDGPPGPFMRWGIYLLVPLQVLWTNMHSSFYLGLLLPWPFVLDAAARRLRGGAGLAPGAGPPRLGHLVLGAGLLVPASAVNPAGWRVFLYPFLVAHQPTLGEIEEVQGLIANIRGMTGGLEEAIALAVLALGTAAVCLLRLRAGDPVEPGTWALMLGAAVAPFAVYRLLPYAGLILSAVALPGLGRLYGGDLPAADRGLHARALPASAPALIVALCGLVVFQTVWRSTIPFGLGVVADTFPSGAARFILATDAHGPIFNSSDFGGYLLWALYPRHRVFIHSDIQNSIADDRIVARFYRSGEDPATFDALAGEYRIELLVLPNGGPSWRFVAADPRWALVYWDQVASVYARRGGANAALIAAREFRVTHYAADLSYLLEAAAEPTRFGAAAAELRRAARDDPENQAARLSLAFLLKTRGLDLPEALAALEAAQARGLRDATLLTWKAEILAGLGRPGEAEAAAREALRVNPAARAVHLVLADLRARAGDQAAAARELHELLARPDLSPDLRRAAEARLRGLASPR